ncbi:MAG TPA: hypothetical protein DCZ95_10165 [Verrucomicrobia bacterium]|nr:MAG: hypothetical protein A2X46_17240 [Lentisphaerae bacterium GWF2_57_35]HBA84446.1 hypothetical protein [Verrucomicrobiota bacterium]
MERLWHYARKGSEEKIGPVSAGEIRNLIQYGGVPPDELLVWAEGMEEWQPASSFPELCTPDIPVPVPAPASGVPLPDGLLGWMSFVGIMTVISGVISCLGCISVISGILMIIAGSALLSARSALEQISRVDESLRPFFDKIRTFMQMSGLVYIVTLLLALLMFFVFFSVIIGAMAAAMGTGV